MATHIADGTGSSLYPYSAMQVISGAAVVMAQGGVGSVILLATASGTGTLTPVLCSAAGALFTTSGAI